MLTTCLKIQEEEGRVGRNILGNIEQPVCEGSEIGKLARYHTFLQANFVPKKILLVKGFEPIR